MLDEGTQPVHPLLLTTAGTGSAAPRSLAVGVPRPAAARVATGSSTALAGAQVPWWLPMLALILVSAVFSYLTGIAAVRRLGSSVASFVALTEVIFAVASRSSCSASGRRLQLVGGALVLAGIALVQRREPAVGTASLRLSPVDSRPGRASGLLVAGTSSDAGKSLRRHRTLPGTRPARHPVAPFKAQNMSNNSMVCADGAEIGRAQYLQAQAAGVEPELGDESGTAQTGIRPPVARRAPRSAGRHPGGRRVRHRPRASGRGRVRAYDELAERYEVIICEGAGSPAEINLRAGDYVNLGLARAQGLPIIVVGDIDRGGVFAALFGTVAPAR